MGLNKEYHRRKCNENLACFIFFLIILGTLAFNITSIIYSFKFRNDMDMIKCTITISYYEYINGASPFNIYGTKWAGTNIIINEAMNNIASFNQKLVDSSLLSDINSNQYTLDCMYETDFQNDLDKLFGPPSSPDSVIQDPPRYTNFSLVPSEASDIPGKYAIEFDRNVDSNDYASRIKGSILNEFLLLRESIPSITNYIHLLNKDNTINDILNNYEEFKELNKDISKFKADLMKLIENRERSIIIPSLVGIYLLGVFLIFHLIICLTIILLCCNEIEIKWFYDFNRCFWRFMLVIIILNSIIIGSLIILGILTNDICDFISLDNLSSPSFKKVASSYI